VKAPETILQSLLERVNTLQMATLDEGGKPYASYSPYIRDEQGNLYVFVSQLAKHTQNLLKGDEVSVLILEDEQDSRQLFARNRLQYQCKVESVNKENEAYDVVLDNMQQQFGETLALLRTLPDFHLFRFTPFSGSLVIGFGQAYQLAGEGLAQLIQVKPNKG
jgi:putative heme iron utilization protein